MGFVFLFIAAFCNITKSYGSKRISSRIGDLSVAVDVTLCRNILCALIGAVILLFSGIQSFYLPPLGWLICTVSGVAIGLNYIVWVLALRSGVYLLSSAASSSSFMLAVLCGLLFWNEQLSLTKGLAILLILLALFFMGKYQKEARGTIKPKHLLLLLLVFLSGGMSSVCQKWFTRALPAMSAHVFTFYSLLISVCLLLAASVILRDRATGKERASRIKGLSGWIVLMAVCFYAVTFFQTKAAALLDAILLYPIYNGTVLAAASLMAWLFFGEKPSKNSIIGVILVFLAVLLAGL